MVIQTKTLQFSEGSIKSIFHGPKRATLAMIYSRYWANFYAFARRISTNRQPNAGQVLGWKAQHKQVGSEFAVQPFKFVSYSDPSNA